MEILIPIYWLSDSLVEGHHKQASQSADNHQWAPLGSLCELHDPLRLLCDLQDEKYAYI
jgi:hypothetical protein